jgi:hypothetical protein
VMCTGVATRGGGETEEKAGFVEDEESGLDGQESDDRGNPVPQSTALYQIFSLRTQRSPPSKAPISDAADP